MKQYRTIVVDPPWEYGVEFPSTSTHKSNDNRRLTKWTSKPLPYKGMDLEAIRALPVKSLAEPSGATLFLWTTNRYLPDAFDVLDAWGAKYRQTVVWAKPPGSRPGFCAAIAPNCAEYLLVAKFGGGEARLKTWSTNVIVAPRGAHSAKPEVFMDLIEQVSPGPYIELFARRAKMGWDCWGNEAPGSIVWPGMDSLTEPGVHSGQVDPLGVEEDGE